MSQQLNLLVKERRDFRVLYLTIGVWVAVVALLLLIALVNQFRLQSARESEKLAAQSLADARGIIKQREDRKALLDGQVAMLKPKVDAAISMLELAKNLGSPDGYAADFVRIADVVEEGVWISGIGLSKSGREIKVQGISLDNDKIMRLSRQMNDVFADRGKEFTSVEMLAPLKSPARPDGSILVATPFVIQ